MSAITQIKAVVHTADIDGAGTDGTVYLGICGREFKLGRADVDDFERSSHREYFLGTQSNVEQPKFNDPRAPQLDTTDTDRFPVYIRFEPQGDSPNWDFDGADAPEPDLRCRVSDRRSAIRTCELGEVQSHRKRKVL